MKSFNYYQPTEIRFGRGKLTELGQIVAKYGERCLIVSETADGVLSPVYKRVKQYLSEANIHFAHFEGVIPNPTTDSISAGAKMAREFGADVVLGVGGGSSMDTAKAIAVEATHPGTCWDYLYFCQKQPSEKTLPIIAVTTTSGTGSQVTQVAVVTQSTTKTKSAIYHSIVFPKVGIVDPDLMVTVPAHVTASTGFDVFCHAFESWLHPGSSPYILMMAREAIRLVVENLPGVVANGNNVAGREALAWADILAGLCIASAGVTLPHGIGMTIGGQCPKIMHGEALAVIYPEFTRYTYPYAVQPFAEMGRVLNPELMNISDEIAAKQACEELDCFLKEIGMWLNLKGLNVTLNDVEVIADNSRVLPDYKNNPRIADRDDIFEMLRNSFERS